MCVEKQNFWIWNKLGVLSWCVKALFDSRHIWLTVLYFTNLQLPSNFSWAQSATQNAVPTYSKNFPVMCSPVDMSGQLSFVKKEWEGSDCLPTYSNSLRLAAELQSPVNYIQSNLDISNSDISNSATLEVSIRIKNTFWLLSPTIIWRWWLFYKSKLPEVQINLHFG